MFLGVQAFLADYPQPMGELLLSFFPISTQAGIWLHQPISLNVCVISRADNVTMSISLEMSWLVCCDYKYHLICLFVDGGGVQFCTWEYVQGGVEGNRVDPRDRG